MYPKYLSKKANMNILGIDYGKKKIGLSLSQGFFASPYQTIEFKSFLDVCQKISLIIQKELVDSLVVGVPEIDRIGARKFGEKISHQLKVPVYFVDETLTTIEAQKLITKKESHKEHEVAASLILQIYLEDKENA